MKVLVVDDSSVMRKVLIKALAQMGVMEVGEAADGQEAVDAVAAEAYDLVLMDWNMPKLLGIDALRAMRANGAAMPIVMVTTEAEKARVLEALKSGATNYLIKPFTQDALIEKVNEVTGGKA